MHGNESENATQPIILSYPENGDERCETIFGFTPKPEQRMVAEHIGRGEDCILIAGCGWGKTLAYFLPLILWENRVIVIISPLVALMEEQHRKLQAVNISSIPIHSGRQLPHNLEDELINGKYRAVFMSPETVFTSVRFELLWNEAAWRSRVQAVVIDEAHCISTWGPEFRKDYSRIGDLRSRLPPGTAFVAVSATLHGQILQDVRRSFHYGSDVTVIKANTDRQNVRYEVRVSNDSRSCHEDLEFLLDFKKTIVYFDKMNDMMAVYRHLRIKAEASQPSLRQSDIIAYFNADLKTETKELYMLKFKRGEIRILLSTEAAGMGCDISDILRVVQFRFPNNITVLAQRLGRAARDPSLQGLGILIYPRT
ncbi:P-loop containing nucleoside triphosphate hydrolase protein, partial [Gamsiella multidivaricata]|uniref:P-loop containing nucleoside triphosphate hydrolase protein n=1 Tax=Gamsiella multidivaricata TaxID=101098 RepID=UPI002220C39D